MKLNYTESKVKKPETKQILDDTYKSQWN